MSSREDNIYVGLAEIDMTVDAVNLGEGIWLRSTYAHLFAPFLAAFRRPEDKGPHPGPWKSANGGFAFDITAELIIPKYKEYNSVSDWDIIRTLVFLIRLSADPAVRAPLISNRSFSEIEELSDNETSLTPYEVTARYFPLHQPDSYFDESVGSWLQERWSDVHALICDSEEFNLAVEALDSGQFVQNSALTLISLWGALEALFSPSSAELRFRISSLMAAFLEAPGIERANRQDELAKLYDKRSSAAHGRPKHDKDDVLKTFNLLREVIFKIINNGYVPQSSELHKTLFGAE